MAMVVRSNLTALNANRQLGVNNSQVAKSLEKLSSGFRINRAGDDASGLAISEKMKAQIKGLEQASSNAQDGISLVQTAEGAMTEVHNMLNRMTELATKSANGTVQNEVDRTSIQAEVDQLVSEIDRIGDATNFNGINLLNGTLGGYKLTETPDATTPATVSSVAISGGNLTAADILTVTTNATGGISVAPKAGAIQGISFEAIDTGKANGTYTLKAIVDKSNDIAKCATPANALKYEGLTITVTNKGTAAVGTTDYTPTADASGNVSSGLTLQVGDTNDSFNKVTVSVDDVRSKGLGIDTLDVSTREAAGNSIKTIKDAINKVSTNRGSLGALQNRLEYAINNLDVTAENMTSANSRIRDTDMAKEMMNYTKMNVLTQSAQAMLAQANQQPQSILQLLQ